ncbi:hypothetical protein EVAR_12807_1 [Eumeta japonica]|uniref:ATP-dependent DNA helicase PIF1 n=1 Tax=Eumeta variegata TaxID=151549 RepID=A0A4C1UC46_EUMVA|nr:hypothetical protein EVAR_12807_1 [Eumeta japonica]
MRVQLFSDVESRAYAQKLLEIDESHLDTDQEVTELGRHIVKATVLTGEAKRDNVLIPRIPIIPNNLPFNFKRLQFPLKVAFSMTINKSQGQTLKYRVAPAGPRYRDKGGPLTLFFIMADCVFPNKRRARRANELPPRCALLLLSARTGFIDGARPANGNCISFCCLHDAVKMGS